MIVPKLFSPEDPQVVVWGETSASDRGMTHKSKARGDRASKSSRKTFQRIGGTPRLPARPRAHIMKHNERDSVEPDLEFDLYSTVIPPAA